MKRFSIAAVTQAYQRQITTMYFTLNKFKPGRCIHVSFIMDGFISRGFLRPPKRRIIYRLVFNQSKKIKCSHWNSIYQRTFFKLISVKFSPVLTSPEKFKNAALIISTIKSTVQTNPTQKRNFWKTLFKPEEP